MNFIEYAFWSAFQGAPFLFLPNFPSVFQQVTPAGAFFLFLQIFSISISAGYPSKQARMNFIQYAFWSAFQGASFLFLPILFFPSVFQPFTLQNKLVWISFNTHFDQRFKARFFVLMIYGLLDVLLLFFFFLCFVVFDCLFTFC